jgi:hypothetical protein
MRYSELASTTPARNVPKAGDRPMLCISRAMPTTRSKAVAVKISRTPDWAIKRKIGRSR